MVTGVPTASPPTSPQLRHIKRPFETPSISLRDLLNTAFYYRSTALKIALSILLIGALVAFILPATYTARTRLLTLNAGLYDMRDGGSSLNARPDPDAAVNVEMQLLMSAELHRRIIVQELGPGASADLINQRLSQFESHLHISKLETAPVLELTFSDRDPKKAAGYLRELLEVYFRERADVLTSGRVAFLTAQRDKIKAQLDAANQRIDAYQTETGVVDVTAQVNAAVEADSVLRQRLADAEAGVADAQKNVGILRSDATTVPADVEIFSDNTETAHTIGAMQSSLFLLEAKRADLSSRYMANSPFVKQVEAQIAELKEAIEAQTKSLPVSRRTGHNTYQDTVKGRLSQAEASLAGVTGRRDVLKGQVAASSRRMRDLIKISNTMALLTMQRDILANIVKDYSAQVEQARIQENQAMSTGSTNVRVIESPQVPTRRSNSLALMLAADVVVALAVATVVVMILSSLRQTFLSPSEAERALKLPVLCDIPKRIPDGPALKRLFGRLVGTVDATPSGGLGKAVLLLAPHAGGETQLVGEYLTQALENRAPGFVQLVYMEEANTSSALGDGITQDEFSSQRRIQSVGLARRRVEKIIRNLRLACDYLILTTPPVEESFESIEISAAANLTLLVIEAEKTRRPVVEAVIAQVASMGGQVHGLILTGRRYYIPAWLYRLLIDRRGSRG